MSVDLYAIVVGLALIAFHGALGRHGRAVYSRRFGIHLDEQGTRVFGLLFQVMGILWVLLGVGDLVARSLL
jgi:hypothetical protein